MKDTSNTPTTPTSPVQSQLSGELIDRAPFGSAPPSLMPVDRTVVIQSPIRDTHFVLDPVTGQVSCAESRLERDYLFELLFDEDVVDYRAQPESIYPYPDSTTRRYTADVSVRYFDGTECRDEVKYLRNTLSDSFKSKHTLIEDYYARRGCTHRVITEESIRRGHLVRNFKYLKPALHTKCPLELAQRFVEITGVSICTVRTAQQLAFQFGFEPSLIARIVAHKLVPCDLISKPWPEIELDFDHLDKFNALAEVA